MAVGLEVVGVTFHMLQKTFGQVFQQQVGCIIFFNPYGFEDRGCNTCGFTDVLVMSAV